MTTYAYAGQLKRGVSVARQVQEYMRFGVPRENILVEDGAEKASLRPVWSTLIGRLARGDLLVLMSLNNLGGTYAAISREWSRLVSALGADICIIDLPAVDTRLSPCVSAAVGQTLTFAAEREQANSALQAKGIKTAKNNGVRFGRPKANYSPEFISAVKRFRNKEITLDEALAITHLKRSNFYYHMRRLKLLDYIAK